VMMAFFIYTSVRETANIDSWMSFGFEGARHPRAVFLP